jgi:hypothetical protein
LIGRCFKGFEWSWYFEGQTEYSFGCKMISVCLDKNIAWHAYLQKLKMVDISFLSVKIFVGLVDVSNIWKSSEKHYT